MPPSRVALAAETLVLCFTGLRLPHARVRTAGVSFTPCDLRLQACIDTTPNIWVLSTVFAATALGQTTGC